MGRDKTAVAAQDTQTDIKTCRGLMFLMMQDKVVEVNQDCRVKPLT